MVGENQFKCLLGWVSPPSGLYLLYSSPRECALTPSFFVQLSICEKLILLF